MNIETLLQIAFIAAVAGLILDILDGRGTGLILAAGIVFLILALKDIEIHDLARFCYTNPDYPECHRVEEWNNHFKEAEAAEKVLDN